MRPSDTVFLDAVRNTQARIGYLCFSQAADMRPFRRGDILNRLSGFPVTVRVIGQCDRDTFERYLHELKSNLPKNQQPKELPKEATRFVKVKLASEYGSYTGV